MTKYQDLLNSLIAEINSDTNQNYQYLSVYFSYSERNTSSQNLENEFKSLIETYLDSESNLSEEREFKQKIINQIVAKATEFDFHQAGFAAYVKLNFATKEIQIWSINLIIAPLNEIYFGDCFDFDQLFSSLNRSKITVVLDLKEKESRLFKFENNELKQILFQSNTFLSSTDGDDQAVMDQSSGKPGKVGSVANNGEKLDWMTEENKHYLHSISDSIHNLKEKFDYLVVFYSSKFSHLLPKLKEMFVGEYNFRHNQVILVEKNLKTEAQIASETKELIFKFEEDCLIKAYTNNTADYKHYTSGWSQTIDAVNNGRVEVLFLKSKLFMQGYLDEMQNLQLEPTASSQTLKNIVPWIIKKVISSAGTVRIIYDNDDLNAVDISAKLRY